MGCSSSKTEPQSPRRRPQGRDNANDNKGGYSDDYSGGNAYRNKNRNRVRNNNVGEDVDDENVRKNQGPIYEKTYKKRIRENLRNASAGEDIEVLEKCMETFVNNRMEDGGDLTEANRRLDFLLTRKEIRDACMRQHPKVLERAIQRVEGSPYRRQLKSHLDRAYYLKQHQEELDTFRHDILQLEQSTISEIRSYHHPPKGVHEAMAATYLCLGYQEKHLTDWQNIQNLSGRYGKDSLLNEISRADTRDLDSETSTTVRKYLNKCPLEQVRTESTAAAACHVWDWVDVTALMGRYGKDSLIREISLADTRKIDKYTAQLARSYLNQYSFEEVRSVSNGAAVFYVWASRMVGKYEGDKKGASQQHTPTKTLTNSRRGNTPTSTEQNPSQFKARPAPGYTSVKDTGQYQNQTKAQQRQNQMMAQQSQKQTKAQQSNTKQAQKKDNKQSPKTPPKNVKDTTKNTANDAKQAAKTSAKDAKQTANTKIKDNKQTANANATQAKNQANSFTTKTYQKGDSFANKTSQRKEPWAVNTNNMKAW